MRILASSLLLFPGIITAISDTKRAKLLLVLSIPFFGLTPVIAFGHRFSVPEISVITLALCYLYHGFFYLQSHEISGTCNDILYKIHNIKITAVFALAFLTFSGVSLVYLSIWTPDIMTHPYNSGSLDAFVIEPLKPSLTNITQYILRTFVIFAILLVGLTFDKEDVYKSLDYIIYGAIFTGASGVIYQYLIMYEMKNIINFLIGFGFRTLNPNPGTFAGLPRMFTTAGEAGYAASLFIFSLALSIGLAIKNSQDRGRYLKYTLLLFVFTLLSTSTTGYGGLLVLTGVFLLVSLTTDYLSFYKVTKWVLGCSAIVIVVLALALISGIPVLDLLVYQFEKMTFSAGSGTLRIRYIRLSLNIFEVRPLLGLGPGSYYGASLLGTLLAETGIIGFLSFVGLYTVYIQLYLQEIEEKLAFPLMISGMTLLLTILFAKSITALLFPWFWASLGLPIALKRTSGNTTIPR